MIYGIQRAHSRIAYLMLATLFILPLVVVISTIPRDEETSTLIIVFAGALLPGIGMTIYHAICYRQIYYDDSYIYIKSFFGKEQDVITYREVIKLVKRTPVLPSQNGDRGATNILSYHTKSGIKTIRFYASFFYRQTDLLKRKLGSYKAIE